MPSLSLFSTSPAATFSESRSLFQHLQQRNREISGSTRSLSNGGARRPATSRELAISANARGIPKQRKPQSRWQKRRRKPQPHLDDTLPSTLPTPSGPLPRLVVFDLDATGIVKPETFSRPFRVSSPLAAVTSFHFFHCLKTKVHSSLVPRNVYAGWAAF